MLEHRIIHGVYCIKETVMDFSRTSVRWITNPLSLPEDHAHLVRCLREHYAMYPNEHMVWVTGDTSTRGNGMMLDRPEWRKGCPDKKMTDNATMYNNRKQ